MPRGNKTKLLELLRERRGGKFWKIIQFRLRRVHEAYEILALTSPQRNLWEACFLIKDCYKKLFDVRWSWLFAFQAQKLTVGVKIPPRELWCFIEVFITSLLYFLNSACWGLKTAEKLYEDILIVIYLLTMKSDYVNSCHIFIKHRMSFFFRQPLLPSSQVACELWNDTQTTR